MGDIVSVTARCAARRRAPAIPCLLSEYGFAQAIACALELRGGVHTGIDLFALSWRLPTPSGVDAAAVSVISPLGIVGRVPDGRIALAYFAPFGGANLRPDTLADLVREKLERRLGDHGWHRFAWALRIASVHAWTDTVRGFKELMDMLPPAETRLALARA